MLVVTYNAFEDLLLKIRNAVSTSGGELKQIGILKKDMAKRKTWVEALPKANS